MRALRIAVIAVASLVGLLVVGAVVLLLVVDPNDYRDQIQRYVQRETGRELTLGGRLDLKFFPWLSLGLQKVALSNPPEFGAEPFVAAESVRVGVHVWPLLHKRLEVSRIAIDGLTVNLIAGQGGHGNWEGLSKTQDKNSAAGGSPLESGSIGGIDVTRAALTYRDETQKSVTRLREVALHTGRLAADEAAELKLQFLMDSGEGTAATRLTLDTHARASGAKLTLADLAPTGEQLPA